MNSRFRSLDPDGHPAKEDQILIDLDQFEADLAASTAALNADANRYAPSAEELAMPPLDLPAPGATRTAAPPAPASVAPPPAATTLTASGAGFDLLSELRQAAEEKAKAVDASESERKARIDFTERAMRGVFRYLNEFAGHLNKIQPLLPQTFRPLPSVELTALRWTESFIDFRTLGGTEVSPLDSLTLRYTLDAGDQVRVDKLPNHAPAYLEELKRVGLRFTSTEQRGTRGMVEQITFKVFRQVFVSLQFKADPEKLLVYLQARNFTGLGQTNYAIAVKDIDQALLDELGKQILGRPSQLFQRLIRQ